jgi:molybdate transport system substrate-binding protein
MKRTTLAGCLLAGLLAATSSQAEEALVAVAANFARAAAQLEQEFERGSDYSLALVIGSTGKLSAQIMNGAPFDLFLAGDQERPRLLEADGWAVAGTRRTYAVGQLSLLSAQAVPAYESAAAALSAGDFRRLAIANPRLAPYGAAAREVLARLGLAQVLADRLVMGENIGQAYALVASGNVPLGLVARSQLVGSTKVPAGRHWQVPPELHAPIRQDLVLLRHGAENKAAAGFAAFIADAASQGRLARFGYAAVP